MNLQRFAKGTLFTILTLVTLPIIAYAAPVVTGITGTVTHGTTVTVSGSGFGQKSTAAPLVWDNCSGTNITTLWSGGWPNNSSNATYNIAYTTPIRSVSLPHSHITKYLVGAHAESNGYNAGYNVMVWRTVTGVSYPTTYYMSSYQREDPSWNGSLGAPQDNNLKTFDFSNGGEPYAMNSSTNANWYANYGVPNNLSSPQWTINDDGGSLNNPDNNSHNFWWGSAVSPLNAWVKTEYEISITNQNTGYIKMWDNGVLVVNYSGPTDKYTGTTKSFALGGYARAQGASTQWRYFADLYFDNTPQRIVICAGSSWGSRGRCEVQIPQTWIDNGTSAQATVTINQGSFADNSTAYLYVVDATGTPNTSGETITFGTGSSGVTPPAAPSGLSVN